MPTSPLRFRPQGDLFDERDLVGATLPETADLRRGLTRTAFGISAGFDADAALSAELAAKESGDPRAKAEAEQLRDQALRLKERSELYSPRVTSLRDAGGVGDVVDFIQGGAPGAALTTLPSLAAAVATRGLAGGQALPYLAGAVPAYEQERGEAALNQYADPELAAKPVEERDAAATAKGLANAALESIVPGTLANSLLREPAKGFVRKVRNNAITEGATEGAQELTGAVAENVLDPSRGIDPVQLLDATVLGAFGGGGLTVAATGVQLTSDATLSRARKAAKEAGNTSEFLRNTFGSPADDVILGRHERGDADEALVGASPEETAGNIRARDEEMAKAAAEFAARIFESPDTPQATKDRLADLGNDYTNPDVRDEIFRAYSQQKSTNKMKNVLDAMLDAAQRMTGVKRSQQEVPGGSNLLAPLTVALAEQLGDNADRAPLFARQLLAINARLGEDTQITPEFAKLLMGFEASQEVLDAISQTAALAPLQKALESVRNIPSARAEVKTGRGFLFSMLTDRMKKTPSLLAGVAEFVDDESLGFANRTEQQQKNVLATLTPVFGSADRARVVLEFYGQQRREAFRQEAEADRLADDRPESEDLRTQTEERGPDEDNLSDDEDLSDAYDGLTENDAAELEASYRNPRPDQPFLAGRDDELLQARVAEAGPNARAGTLAELVELTGEDPSARANAIRADLKKRLRESERRDTKTVQEAIAALESFDNLTQEQRNELAALKKLRTTDRKDLPALREERQLVTKIEQLAEKQARSRLRDQGVEPGPEFESQVRRDVNEATLRLYSAVLRPENELQASDDRIRQFRKAIDQAPDPRQGDETKQARARHRNMIIDGTKVKFEREGAAPLTLSLESMLFASKGEGTIAQRLAESIGEVMNRSDVTKFVEPHPNAVVYLPKDQPAVLWRDVAQEIPGLKGAPEKNDGLTPAQRSQRKIKQIEKQAAKRRYAQAQAAIAEAKTVPAVNAALRAVEDQLLEKEGVDPSAVSEALRSKTLNEAKPAVKRAIIARLKKWTQQLRKANERSEPKSAGDYAIRTKLKIVGDALRDAIVTLHPDGKDIRRQLEDLKEDTGRRGDANARLKDQSVTQTSLEERIEIARARVQEAEGEKNLQAWFQKRLDELETQLDELIRDSVREEREPNVGGYNAQRDPNVRATPEERSRAEAIGRFLEQVRLGNEFAAALIGRLTSPTKTKNKDPNDADGARAEEAIKDLFRKIHKENTEAVVKARKSEQNVDGDPLTPEEQKRIRDEIHRLRGPQVQVLFETLAKLGSAGTYRLDERTGKRIISLALELGRDALGVARHESLHDFFVTLLKGAGAGRKLKRDLENAANSPAVRRQLRELLKDHPAALEQAERDVEERAAYMYQFWAAGALNLKPEAETFFQRVAQFFREVFRISSAGERAEEILVAFHDGRFNESSLDVAREVVANFKTTTLKERLESLDPGVRDLVRKVFQAAPDRLRSFDHPVFDKLADMFSSETGKLGFIQRRFQQEGVWENKLATVLSGMSPEQQFDSLRHLQARRTPRNDAERGLRDFLEEMHTYMTKAGVKDWDAKLEQYVELRYVRDYFPRQFDREKLLRDPSGFIRLLRKYNVSEDEAFNIHHTLTQGSGQIDLAENEKHLGYTPFAAAVKSRKLEFITRDNAAEFAEWQSDDLVDVLFGYVKQAVHRAEYTRYFGPRGEKIQELLDEARVPEMNPEQIEEIGKIIRALEGTEGNDLSSQTKEIMATIRSYQDFVLLPLTLFAQMIDPVVLAARSGKVSDATKAYGTALKRLGRFITKDTSKVDGEEMATLLGIISEDTTLEAMGATYGSSYMSARLRRWNRAFFRWNGMQGWNNSMRIAATAAGERYLMDSARTTAEFDELGLQRSDIVVENGRMVVDPDQLAQKAGRDKPNQDDLDRAQRLGEAMFRFVDSAILRPSASSRPVWMSDPRFILVGHLKQFTFAMHNVVLKRAAQQLEAGNPVPTATLLLTVPVMLASDMAKMVLTGTVPSNWDAWDFVLHAVSRSGLLGLGDFGTQVVADSQRGQLPGESLLGPSIDHLLSLLRWLTDSMSTEQLFERSVPGARYV